MVSCFLAALTTPPNPETPLMPHDACSFAGLEKGLRPREFTAESGPDGSLVPAGAPPVLEGLGVQVVLPTWVWEGGENRATLLFLTPSPWRAVTVAVATPGLVPLGTGPHPAASLVPRAGPTRGQSWALLGGGRGRLRE